jgi:hypothetical protein
VRVPDLWVPVTSSSRSRLHLASSSSPARPCRLARSSSSPVPTRSVGLTSHSRVSCQRLRADACHPSRIQGIGKAIVTLLAQSPPEPPLTIYLCSRDPSRGDSTLKEVEAAKKGPHQVRLGKLDVLDQASVDAFRGTIEKEHGKVRIVAGGRLRLWQGPAPC